MQESPEAIFARRLKQRREGSDMSQATLAATVAAKSGLRLDPTAITRIERGIRKVSLNEATALAEALDTDLPRMIRPESDSEREALVAVSEAQVRELSEQLTALLVQIGELAGYQRSVDTFREAADGLERTLRDLAPDHDLHRLRLPPHQDGRYKGAIDPYDEPLP